MVSEALRSGEVALQAVSDGVNPREVVRVLRGALFLVETAGATHVEDLRALGILRSVLREALADVQSEPISPRRSVGRWVTLEP